MIFSIFWHFYGGRKARFCNLVSKVSVWNFLQPKNPNTVRTYMQGCPRGEGTVVICFDLLAKVSPKWKVKYWEKYWEKVICDYLQLNCITAKLFNNNKNDLQHEQDHNKP